jgi:hypothetical protein
MVLTVGECRPTNVAHLADAEIAPLVESYVSVLEIAGEDEGTVTKLSVRPAGRVLRVCCVPANLSTVVPMGDVTCPTRTVMDVSGMTVPLPDPQQGGTVDAGH